MDDLNGGRTGRQGTSADAEPSVVASAVVGALAFAAGYLVTYGTALAVGLKQELLGSDTPVTAGTDIATVENVGVLFYSAHHVDLSAGVIAFDVLGAAVGEEPLLTALWAVPPLAILVAGALLGRGARDGAAAGARLTLGYLPLAVAGTFVFEVSAGVLTNAATASPDLVTAVVLAGLAYPLLFGAVGGWLGDRL